MWAVFVLLIMFVQIRTESEWMAAAVNHTFVVTGSKSIHERFSSSEGLNVELDSECETCEGLDEEAEWCICVWMQHWVFLCVHVGIRKVWRGGLLSQCEVENCDWPFWRFPIDPHYSCINGRPAGLDCHHREWKHMQLEMHPRDAEGPRMMTKLSAPARVYLQNFQTF